jgi:alginate O-acetyltransferase complex protein AlgI
VLATPNDIVYGGGMSGLSIFLSIGALPFLLFYFRAPLKLQNAGILGVGIVTLFLLDWRLPALHMLSAVLIYFCAKRVVRQPRWLSVGVLGLVAALIFFRSLNYGFRYEELLKAVTLAPSVHEGLALSAAMSIYTLLMIGYLFEVKRRRIEPAKTFGEFLLFTTFFPIALVGPIERFANLSGQFARRRDWDSNRATQGAFLILFGIFKKLALADPLAPFLNHLDTSTDTIRGWGLLAYCFLAYVQIYCGFSGLIDIARGMSALLGFRVIENFDRPYMATNIISAWQRWNISLIQWLKEFVYIPLVVMTRNPYVSVAAVILLAGLWHDIAFRYLIWAAYWIVLQWVYIFARMRGWLGPTSRVTKIMVRSPGLARLCTFTLICLSTFAFMIIPGRVSFLDLVIRLFELDPASFWTVFTKVSMDFKLLAFVAVCILVVFFVEGQSSRLLTAKPLRLVSVCLLLILLTATFGDIESAGFIYLRY